MSERDAALALLKTQRNYLTVWLRSVNKMLAATDKTSADYERYRDERKSLRREIAQAKHHMTVVI
jgi:hypothetical protein